MKWKAHLITCAISLSGDECSIGSATDLTESSSVVDGDWTMVDENFSTLSLTQSELEHISMELASKGPHKSQVQLRWVSPSLRTQRARRSLCRWIPLRTCCPPFVCVSYCHSYRSLCCCFMSSYLLHIFMEAGCLDWCVVIGLILRESSVVSQLRTQVHMDNAKWT